MKIIFMPNHGRALANCIIDYTVVATDVLSIEDFLNMNLSFVIKDKRNGKIINTYNRDWVRFEDDDYDLGDDRIGIDKMYSVFAGARYNTEKAEVELIEDKGGDYIGNICEVADCWNLDDYPEYNHVVMEP